ncbi:ATP-dependent DNA helicase DinG [Gilvimarinus agarilyticus]|uniref:ATP-dependent DNA helicase DinG n=1 Tax=unclassified Gilvimarinus TaxID=2642066 RepID=UPI001C089CC0|nr:MULTISPECIES: ATP-dependent DNA helicase DinG [unclassified Gilvimarinus]MBU2884646.1 ATP-dependent DNA helicase DinG [Gilvimarinus agarilyticus]MDO6569753.1 ATP-dependent DNA helicase DinG [Gilvimarinus sp. 2_MG-2023]MDO6747433.1 ATP-dependent DNA helicase DinG [Gilvimarinus sp. 1_MG-2023]
MLTDDIKRNIQESYSAFLQSRELGSRHGQKMMIAEIARTLGSITSDAEGVRNSDGHVCVVEAGTGTGKTIAYLLPSIIIAKALGKKLVVSTATVALQEQIIHKDLPELKNHSDLSFSFALAKGRGRYLCLSKLDNLMSEFASTVDPTRALYEDELPSVDEQGVRLYESMMDALAANKWDGERDSWPSALESADWQRVTTDHRQCTGRRCSNVSACSFFKARDALHNADCIVTNHDLVLADLALGGGAILPDPEETIYVFDEGHHLPDKALNHFAHHTRMLSTSRWLEQCNKGLSTVLGQIGGAGRVDHFAEQLPGQFIECKRELDMLYPALDELVQSVAESNRDRRSNHYRFDNGVVPDGIQSQAEQLHASFDRLSDLLSKISAEINEAMEDAHCPVPKVDLENNYPVVGAWQSRAEASAELWLSYARTDNDASVPRARWLTLVDFSGNYDIEVCSSPILAARTLEFSLWNRAYGAVVTSATLTALGKFDRFKMRAGTPDNSRYAVVPSPFDFSRGELIVPRDAVDAGNSAAHTQSVIEQLPVVLDPAAGSLVLFSSRRQMLDVFDAMPSAWQDKIQVQGEASKQEMLSAHKKRIDRGEGSVLFGLASFAEGVDLPGDYCAHVVIAKLPFAVPDDPIEAAVSEWIESRGGNAFMQITIPDASLKLIQACGRLLRTEGDDGRITLLDRRVVTKRYGKAILDSLPPFARKIDA